MELKHMFEIPASVQKSWDAFNDIQAIAGCFPGATLGEIRGDDFDGTVRIKLGPITMTYAGEAAIVRRDSDTKTLVIRAHGKDKRGQGTAEAMVTVRLDGSDSQTTVDVMTDLAITGKPAQFGRGMIQDVSEKLLGQFVTALSAQLATASAGPAVSEGAAGTPDDRVPPAAPAELKMGRTVATAALKHGVVGLGRVIFSIITFKRLRRRMQSKTADVTIND